MPPEVKVPEFIERGFTSPMGRDAGDFRFNVMAIMTVLAGVLFVATGYDRSWWSEPRQVASA